MTHPIKINHTPTPWTVFTEETCDGENVYPKIMSHDFGHEVFEYGQSSSKHFADADFIVHCVNCHDELRETLEEIVLDLELEICCGGQIAVDLEKIRKLITKARGQ